MSDSKIENTVNKLVSFVCENVKKNNWTSIRDSVTYLNDFQNNQRCTQYSVIKYDYELKKSIKLSAYFISPGLTYTANSPSFSINLK